MLIPVETTSGIYMLTCEANGKIYIGSAQSFRRRLGNHVSRLNRHKHPNIHLQRAWDKYGQGNFRFEIVELCAHDGLLQREQYYLDLLQPFKPHGFNIALDALSPRKGIHPSQETIDKMSAIMSGRTYTPEHRAKMSAYSKNRSPEHRAKISNNAKRILGSTQMRAKLFLVQAKGYIFTTPDGEKLEAVGLNKFCEEHGLCASAMAAVARGKRNHHKGWKCEHLAC